MKGRPLVNDELYEPLISHNYGRNTELKHRNKLLLLMAGIVGLREIELTLVTMGLFISPTGEINELVILPDTVTRDSFERPIIMSHSEVTKAFEQYLTWLKANEINTLNNKHYLGFDPNAQLFVNDDLKPFTTQSRGESISPYAMNKRLDQLIKNSGLNTTGVTRLSLVRTCVIESYKADMSTTDISVVTGFSVDSIKKILIMDIGAYSPIADWFTKRAKQKHARLESMKMRRKFQI